MHENPYTRLLADLRGGKTIVLDGGTGTELERRGAPMHGGAWCAVATHTNPDLLRTIHQDYIRAGARIITANTFSTNRLMLEPASLGDRFHDLNLQAVAIAREARDRMQANDTVAVAGSMSHQIPLPPGTDSRDPSRIPPLSVVKGYFEEMASVLCDAGVDFIALEMMSDPALANPAIDAALGTGLPVWIGFSCRRGTEDGKPRSWTRPELTVDDMMNQCRLEGADVVGVMHSRVDITGAIIEMIKHRWRGPISAYPDTGHFEMPNWVWDDAISPADFAIQAVRWVDQGVQLVGGCCGMGVEHIEALSTALARR